MSAEEGDYCTSRIVTDHNPPSPVPTEASVQCLSTAATVLHPHDLIKATGQSSCSDQTADPSAAGGNDQGSVECSDPSCLAVAGSVGQSQVPSTAGQCPLDAAPVAVAPPAGGSW